MGYINHMNKIKYKIKDLETNVLERFNPAFRASRERFVAERRHLTTTTTGLCEVDYVREATFDEIVNCSYQPAVIKCDDDGGDDYIPDQSNYLRVRLSGSKVFESPSWVWLKDHIAWKRAERYGVEDEVRDSIGNLSKQLFEHIITTQRFNLGPDSTAAISARTSNAITWCWTHSFIFKMRNRNYHPEDAPSVFDNIVSGGRAVYRACVGEANAITENFERIESRLQRRRDRYDATRRGRRTLCEHIDEDCLDCFARQYIKGHQLREMPHPLDETNWRPANTRDHPTLHMRDALSETARE